MRERTLISRLLSSQRTPLRISKNCFFVVLSFLRFYNRSFMMLLNLNFCGSQVMEEVHVGLALAAPALGDEMGVFQFPHPGAHGILAGFQIGTQPLIPRKTPLVLPGVA